MPEKQERKSSPRGRTTTPAAAGGSKQSSTKSNGAARGDLRRDMREFASARPSGWGHDDWLNFLESLRSRGHNIEDTESIGLALERERLDLALSEIRGVGPQRREALIQRYGNVWSLRHADVDEIAIIAKAPRVLAERIKAELR